MPPNFVTYGTPAEYMAHYKRQYCHATIQTADGIRVYFKETRFWHAFCVRDENGRKDAFSPERAKYIDWIKETLEHASAEHFQGWNKHTQKYEPERRVSVVLESFVVVLDMFLKRDGTLKAEFVTAYYADRSITKIKSSPKWDKAECLKILGEDRS